jgi:hypothetical protein
MPFVGSDSAPVSTPVPLTPASIGKRLPAAHREEKKEWTMDILARETARVH